MKNILSLTIFIVLAFAASAWGGLITSFYKEPWYSTIAKPSFNPPSAKKKTSIFVCRSQLTL